MSSDGMPHRKYPCGECPWQVKAPLGKFPAERYEQLRSTCRPDAAGIPPLPGAPMFGCHVGDPGTGEDLACAGWLVVEGHNHMGVRVAVMEGRLSMEALDRGDNWPELYESYEAMAEANGAAAREDVR
ncbi:MULTISPECIES: DUF6283 family protein [unclassified Nonomuraea]|uniref:DUF6283 family protein n=1 Tax=unclassified Nonomuraea TaxID=2593643 RepID=UPI0033E75E72